MRKQSAVMLAPYKPTTPFDKDAVRKDKDERKQRQQNTEFVGLICPPNPLDKPSIQRVSAAAVKLPPGFVGKNFDENKKTVKRHKLDKRKPSLESEEGFEENEAEKKFEYDDIKNCNKKANDLLDSLIKEDLKWAAVPDDFHSFTKKDFTFKLDSSKLKVCVMCTCNVYVYYVCVNAIYASVSYALDSVCIIVNAYRLGI
jgi:hypothetical protein